jgi:predicted MPP superfamily phosphohydrolase
MNMALTRKMLKAMELDEDKISQIIDAHQATVDEIAKERDALKADAEKYKADSEKLAAVEKDLVKAKAKLEDADEVSKKYKALQEEYANYKNDVTAKTAQEQREKAYRALLAEAGVSDKRIDSIIKVTDLSKIEIGEDGKVKDAKTIVEGIKTEWADFIQTQGTQGAKTSTPPASDPSKTFSRDDIKKMSAEEINKNWDSIKESLKQI